MRMCIDWVGTAWVKWSITKFCKKYLQNRNRSQKYLSPKWLWILEIAQKITCTTMTSGWLVSLKHSRVLPTFLLLFRFLWMYFMFDVICVLPARLEKLIWNEKMRPTCRIDSPADRTLDVPHKTLSYTIAMALL